jgi:hypothetical protein
MIDLAPYEKAAKDAAEKVKLSKAELNKAELFAKVPGAKADAAEKLTRAREAYNKAVAAAKEADKALADAKLKKRNEDFGKVIGGVKK